MGRRDVVYPCLFLSRSPIDEVTNNGRRRAAVTFIIFPIAVGESAKARVSEYRRTCGKKSGRARSTTCCICSRGRPDRIDFLPINRCVNG